jgi:hypothetical protein
MKTGLVKIDPDDFTHQKELPVSRLLVKVRANYLNYISKLCNIMGKTDSDEDPELEEYE